jgi:hypothetical protein
MPPRRRWRPAAHRECGAAGHRHIAMIEKEILRVICVELRHYCGLPTAEAIPIGELELEHVWVLHGGLFY